MSRLIDADAFKEYICNAYEQVKHMYPDGGKWAREITEDFCKDIDEQPTIEPQKWIPVSARLPEEHVDVLCCFTSHGKTRIRVSHRMDYNYWNEVGRTGDMVAWQPLPEPWKGEEE